VWLSAIAAIDAYTAIANGADPYETITLSVLSVGQGYVLGEVGEAGGPLGSLTVGAISSAVSTAFNDFASGRELGWDVLMSVGTSTASWAVSYGFARSAAVSQANISEHYSQGYGSKAVGIVWEPYTASGERLVEVIVREQASGRAADEAQWTQGYGSFTSSAPMAGLGEDLASLGRTLSDFVNGVGACSAGGCGPGSGADPVFIQLAGVASRKYAASINLSAGAQLLVGFELSISLQFDSRGELQFVVTPAVRYGLAVGAGAGPSFTLLPGGTVADLSGASMGFEASAGPLGSLQVGSNGVTLGVPFVGKGEGIFGLSVVGGYSFPVLKF
jgi:hypothetical protein